MTIKTKLSNQLRTKLNAHYKYHKLHNALNQFQDLFCIDDTQMRELKTCNLLFFATARKTSQFNSYGTSEQRQEIYIYFFFTTNGKNNLTNS